MRPAVIVALCLFACAFECVAQTAPPRVTRQPRTITVPPAPGALDGALNVRLRQAQALIAAGMVDQGVGALRGLTEERPDIPLLLRAYVEALHNTGQAEQAQDYLTARLQKDAQNVDARILLARIQFLRGNKGDADATWSAALAQRSDDEATYRSVAEMRHSLGDAQGAEATYLAARRALKKPDAFALELEQIHKAAGQIDAAMQDCLVLLRRAENGPVDPWIVEELFSLLKLAQDPGAGSSRANATISALDGLASQRTDSPELRRLLLRVLVMQGRGEQAVARAAQWDRAGGGEARGSALVALARVATDAADTATTAQAARRALTLDVPRADMVTARTIVARAAEASGQLEEALVHYRALAGMGANAASDWSSDEEHAVLVEAPLKIAELDRRTGRTREALEQYAYLRMRAGTGPRADDIRLAQADCYVTLERTAEAIAVFDSVAQTGVLPVARERAVYGGAEAALIAGNPQDAATRFRAVADLFPEGALVNDALGRLLLIGEGASDPAALARYARGDRHARAGLADSAFATFASLATQTSGPLAPSAKLRCAQLASRPDDARAQYASLLETWPTARVAPDALLGEADLCAGALHQPEKALELYGQFLETYPAHVFVSEVRRKANRLRRAEVK